MKSSERASKVGEDDINEYGANIIFSFVEPYLLLIVVIFGGWRHGIDCTEVGTDKGLAGPLLRKATPMAEALPLHFVDGHDQPIGEGAGRHQLTA